ncbi:MAG: 16S rRNA (cytosine(967)-C(5))-methyltransferase RsmB [Pseudomonadota bacterium]
MGCESEDTAGAGCRAEAAHLVSQVMWAGRSLNDLLDIPRPHLESRDRAFLAELVYGVLREQRHLEAILAARLTHPLLSRDRDRLLQALLWVGIYQLLHTRVAEHAAVHATVQAARLVGSPHATGLVNGILRRVLREREALQKNLPGDPAAAFPDWWVTSLRSAWPRDWQSILQGSQARPPMTLRVNDRRIRRDAYLEQLEREGIEVRVCVHSPVGVTLVHPLEVSRLPGFAEGLVSVQDEAAQLAAPLLAVKAGQRILDACAAPGGKTAHLLEGAPLGVALTALDHDPVRLARVRDTLTRLGLGAGVELVVGDAAAPKGLGGFDRILLDAPCSAAGVIRRHPDIKFLRRHEDIATLSGRQARMLATLWDCLKPGGVLLYATCSVFPEENERLIQSFLACQPEAQPWPIEALWGRAVGAGRQILPGEAGMDGFYYARLRKVSRG